jgi:hypothetical protein
MQRVTCCGVAAVVLVALVATAVHSQAKRPRARVSPQNQQLSGTPLGPGAPDPNLTAEQQIAQRQQDMQQRVAEMERHVEEGRRRAKENLNNAIRQMVGATDEQWPKIKEKLDLIDRLKSEAGVSMDLSSFGRTDASRSSSKNAPQSTVTSTSRTFSGGGVSAGVRGSMVSSPGPHFGPARKDPASATDGEVLCEQLLQDLTTPGTPQADIAQRVAALRKIRAQAQERLAQARKDLRSLMVSSQELALIAMGYLE